MIGSHSIWRFCEKVEIPPNQTREIQIQEEDKWIWISSEKRISIGKNVLKFVVKT